MSTRIVVTPELYKLIQKFDNFGAILEKYLDQAGAESSDVLVLGAKDAMDWKNPTGNLEESIQPYRINAKYFEIGTNVVYGPRRNWGFSGKTDSRGRYYANDPGKFFMEKSIKTSKQTVQDIYVAAVKATLVELAVGA